MPDTGLSLQTMRLLHFAPGKEKCTVKKGTVRKQAGIRARQKVCCKRMAAEMCTEYPELGKGTPEKSMGNYSAYRQRVVIFAGAGWRITGQGIKPGGEYKKPPTGCRGPLL